MNLQDHIEIALRNGGYVWPYRFGVYSLQMLSPKIPAYGMRLAWAIWRLKRRGIVRTEWDHSYKQTMIGLVK